MNRGPYLCMAEKSINSVRTGKKRQIVFLRRFRKKCERDHEKDGGGGLISDAQRGRKS